MNILAIILQATATNVSHAAAEEFKRMDPYGIGMTGIAMIVVFSVLAIIYLTFKYFSKLYNGEFKKNKVVVASEVKTSEMVNLDSDTAAAISLAIHMYMNQQHDLDSLSLTINRVSRMYSPWSSKIYTLRQLPR